MEEYKIDIQDAINQAFDAIKAKSITNYAVLLSGPSIEATTWGSFYFLNDSSLSPSSPPLSSHITLFNKAREELGRNLVYSDLLLYDSLFLYGHIWESFPLQFLLYKMATILDQDTCPWVLPMNIIQSIANFYKDHIIKVFNKKVPLMRDLLKDIYDSEIRNDIAHSSFSIHDINSRISFGYKPTIDKNGNIVNAHHEVMSISQWEEKLNKTIFFRQCLLGSLYKRKFDLFNDHSIKEVKTTPPYLTEPAFITWEKWYFGEKEHIMFSIKCEQLDKSGRRIAK